MIAYTTNQIFDILGRISCQSDLIEIEHYVLSYPEFYSPIDRLLFNECITQLNEILK